MLATGVSLRKRSLGGQIASLFAVLLCVRVDRRGCARRLPRRRSCRRGFVLAGEHRGQGADRRLAPCDGAAHLLRRRRLGEVEVGLRRIVGWIRDGDILDARGFRRCGRQCRRGVADASQSSIPNGVARRGRP